MCHERSCHSPGFLFRVSASTLYRTSVKLRSKGCLLGRYDNIALLSCSSLRLLMMAGVGCRGSCMEPMMVSAYRPKLNCQFHAAQLSWSGLVCLAGCLAARGKGQPLLAWDLLQNKGRSIALMLVPSTTRAHCAPSSTIERQKNLYVLLYSREFQYN